MEKSTTKQFLKKVPGLIGLCIEYIELEDSQYKTQLATKIRTAWNNMPEYDFHSMYDEVSEKIEVLLKENTEKRYIYSLITPFREYSNIFHGEEITRLLKENITELNSVENADTLAKIFEKQIKNVENRSTKFFEIIHDANYVRDEIEIIFFELVTLVHWYGNMLDAAFAVNGVNLYTIQTECGVCVKQFWSKSNLKLRMEGIVEYVGSYTLAESYLKKLVNQKQPEIKAPSDNTSLQEESPSYWQLENREQYQRFTLDVSFRDLYNLCVNEKIGIMNKDITFDYFSDVVQRAQFGKIYKSGRDNRTVTKIRLLVTLLSNHTRKTKEYRQTAAISMEIKEKLLGQFNISENDKFRVELENIL